MIIEKSEEQQEEEEHGFGTFIRRVDCEHSLDAFWGRLFFENSYRIGHMWMVWSLQNVFFDV